MTATDKNGTSIKVGDYVICGSTAGRIRDIQDPWAIEQYWIVIETFPNKKVVGIDCENLEKASNEKAMLLMLEWE